MVRRLVIFVPGLLLVAAPARATYSVVATDRLTRQVGSAVTSCVGIASVAGVYGPAPGHGGIDAQAVPPKPAAPPTAPPEPSPPTSVRSWSWPPNVKNAHSDVTANAPAIDRRLPESQRAGG